jgi:hypothetical protein
MKNDRETPPELSLSCRAITSVLTFKEKFSNSLFGHTSSAGENSDTRSYSGWIPPPVSDEDFLSGLLLVYYIVSFRRIKTRRAGRG